MKHTMIEHSAGITALECDFQQARNEYRKLREQSKLFMERLEQMRACLLRTWMQEHYPHIECDISYEVIENGESLNATVKVLFDADILLSESERICNEFAEYTKALVAR